MTIKEEPQIIEFVYECEDDPNKSYALKYYTEDNKSLVSVARGDYIEIFPLGFFKEVYEHLQLKGVIKGKSSRNPSSFSSSTISPPKIDKKDDSVDNVFPTSFMPAFSSFDIPSAAVSSPTQGEKSERIKVSSSDDKEIVKRPVIRSRVTNDEDPLSAERDAALLRGESGEGKGFRRKD
jgi:hypothetical protein